MIRIARPLTENLKALGENTRAVTALLELDGKGLRVFCALDFSEIYEYAFPMEASGERWSRDLHGRAEEAALLQITLAFLLSDDRDILEKQLVILPQHLLEMGDVLAVKASRSQALRNRLLESPAGKVRKLVAELGGQTRLEEVLERWRTEETITEEFVGELLSLASRYRSILELLSAISGDLSSGFEAVHALFASQRIRCSESLWPKFRPEPETILTSSRAWTKEIHRLRGGDPRRYASSATDGQALAYLSSLNKHLLPNGELVLLATHSQTLLSVSSDMAIDVTAFGIDHPVPCVLSPTWAAVYLVHHCALKDRTKSMLAHTQTEVASILSHRRRPSATRTLDRRQVGLAKESARKMELQLLQRLEKAEQLALASQTHRLLEALDRPISNQQMRVGRLLRTLLEVCSNAEISARMISEATRQLDNVPALLDSILTTYELPDLGLRRMTSMTAEAFPVVAHAAIRKVVVKGPPGLFPYSIQFRNEQSQQLSTEIASLIDRRRFFAAYEQLVLAFASPSVQPEVYLLLGFFFAVLGEYRTAIDILDRGLSPEDDGFHELLFLKAVAHRLLGEYGEAQRACTAAVERKRYWAEAEGLTRKEDPRYLNELSILLHRAGMLPDVDAERVDVLRKAVGRAEEVLALAIDDIALQIRAYNNKAYLYLELFSRTCARADLDAASSAESMAVRIFRRRSGQTSLTWHPEYTDTRLWVTFKKWEHRGRLSRRLLKCLREGYCHLDASTARDREFSIALSAHQAGIEGALATLGDR